MHNPYNILFTLLFLTLFSSLGGNERNLEDSSDSNLSMYPATHQIGGASMEKIIIDTDIGTDIDDAFALLLALKSPEIQLEAVTTAHGDTDTRSRIAMKILKLSGRQDIPVGSGISMPLLREREAKMQGFEGKGFLEPVDFEYRPSKHAVDLIISKVMENPKEITIVTIGPLTNLAVAIIKEPAIIENIKQVISMGGVIGTPKLGWSPGGEYNFNSDPEAARIVFSSGIPIIMVGLDVTLDVWLQEENINKLKTVKTPLMDGVLSMLEIWLERINSSQTCLHDPLAASVAIDKSLVTTKKMHVALEMKDGFLRTVPYEHGEPNVEVCIGVDADGFLKLFMERMMR